MGNKLTVGKIEQLTTEGSLDKQTFVPKLTEVLPHFTIDEMEKIAKYANAAKKLIFQEKEWEMNHEITSGDVSLVIKAIESVMREKKSK